MSDEQTTSEPMPEWEPPPPPEPSTHDRVAARVPPPDFWEPRTTIVSRARCTNTECEQFGIEFPNFDPDFVGVEVRCGACTEFVEECG